MNYGNKMKWYECKCIKCGYNHFWKTEYELNTEYGCPVCTGRKVKKGINDIATTSPWMIEYFINKDDNFVYLDYYFEKNDVNEKYRKVLFQIVPLKNKAIEFISGLEFDTAFLSKVDSLSIFLKPYVAGNSNLVKVIEDDAIGYQEYEGIVFNADIKSKKNYDYIINFLKDIKNNDELEKYIRSISCFMADGIIYTKERKIVIHYFLDI